IRPLLKLGHIPEVRNVGVVMRQNGAGELLDLGEPDWLPAKRMPGGGCGFDSAAHAQVVHATALRPEYRNRPSESRGWLIVPFATYRARARSRAAARSQSLQAWCSPSRLRPRRST